MFNLDDYYVCLQKKYKDMLSASVFTGIDKKNVIRGWCFGQMDSLNIMFQLDIIDYNECDFLFKYLQSILSDLNNNK